MAKATAKKSKSKAKPKSKAKVSARKRTKLPKRAKKAKIASKSKKKPTKKATKKTTKRSITTKRPLVKKMAEQAATPEILRVQAGDVAPDFTLPNQEGTPVTLSSFRGKNVVLYFYPKDDTPGCTKEACSFRDNIGSFETANTIILGVSFDDQASHQKFIEKYGLNFQLLSDTTKDVAKSYGVFVQKYMYGNISWGIERSTFLIDTNGIIKQAIRRVQVDGHTEQVLAGLTS